MTVVYTACAVVPALILLAWLYHRDVLHASSKRTIYRLYLLGAAIVLPAGLLERVLLQNSVMWKSSGITMTLTTAFFAAGLVEEFLKAAIVERGAIQRGAIHNPMDCVILSGAVALGFATVENILYVTSAGFSTAVLRSVTAIPAHLMFGVMMGAGFIRNLYFGANRGWAYIIPALAHGLYDSFALAGSWMSDALLVVYLLVMLEYALRQIDWAGQLARSRIRQLGDEA